MISIAKRSTYAAVACALALIAMSFWWLRAEHTPEAPIRVAQEFLKKLEAKQFAQAFELTVKQGYVGRTPEELQEVSRQALCELDRMVSTFPFQSNGNRLRRFVSGREIEMAQVLVEFEGRCLLGVTVQRTKDQAWRVYRFASHAG